jgi:hypothetical protein
MEITRITIAAMLLGFFPVAVSVADTPCTPLNRPTLVRSTLASAGFFANLRNAPHSVSFQINQILSEARQARSELLARELMCRHSCKDAVPAMILRSTPHQTLLDYDEFQRCEELRQTTSRAPIRFSDRRFASAKEAQEWFEDLTQGDGPDGEALYKLCPGRCSPEYTSTEYLHDNSVVTSVSAVCSHARDRSDDQFSISASIVWICFSQIS